MFLMIKGLVKWIRVYLLVHLCIGVCRSHADNTSVECEDILGVPSPKLHSVRHSY